MNKNLHIIGGAALAIMMGVVAVLNTTGPTKPNTSKTDLLVKSKVEDLTKRLKEERAELESTADVAGADRGKEIIAQTNALIKRTNQRLGIEGIEEVERRVVSKASVTDPKLQEINSKIEILREELEQRRSRTL